MKVSRTAGVRAAALICFAALSSSVAMTAFAQLLPQREPAAAPIERFGISGPIHFGEADYGLSWSSHPSADLYKQEYLPTGEDPDRYASMVMVDLRLGGGNAVQTAIGMSETLKARKATDPVVNYDLLLKPEGDEALLDFVMSSEDASGEIIEWNAYRYTNAAGGRGTQMVGISRRAYGDTEARAFLTGLKQSRVKDIDTLADMQIPVAKASMP